MKHMCQWYLKDSFQQRDAMASSFDLLCFYGLGCFCLILVLVGLFQHDEEWINLIFFQQGLMWPGLALKSLCNTSDLEFLNLPPSSFPRTGITGTCHRTTCGSPSGFWFVFHAFMNSPGWRGAGRGYAHGLVCMCTLPCACGGQRLQVFPSNMLVRGFKRQWSDLAASSFIVWTILPRPHSGFLSSFHIWFNKNMFCGKMSICLNPGFVTEKTELPGWLRCSSVSLADLSRRRPSLPKNEIGLWYPDSEKRTVETMSLSQSVGIYHTLFPVILLGQAYIFHFFLNEAGTKVTLSFPCRFGLAKYFHQPFVKFCYG